MSCAVKGLNKASELALSGSWRCLRLQPTVTVAKRCYDTSVHSNVPHAPSSTHHRSADTAQLRAVGMGRIPILGTANDALTGLLRVSDGGIGVHGMCITAELDARTQHLQSAKR